MGKGGGHNKGQTMPYSVVRAWDSGKPFRSPHWTLGAAEADMLDSLRAANRRGAGIEIRVIDRTTGETVAEPKRCEVCRDRWATELAAGQFGANPTRCYECEDADMSEVPVPAALGLSGPLVKELRAKGLEPVARQDGTVTVMANDIEWTLRPEPHAVTGEPCGVWSAVGPAGSRGMFGAANAAEFVVQRRTP